MRYHAVYSLFHIVVASCMTCQSLLSIFPMLVMLCRHEGCLLPYQHEQVVSVQSSTCHVSDLHEHLCAMPISIFHVYLLCTCCR